MNSYIEITSPVGSFESLAAAVQAGAGSVYFGVGKLNMRSRSAANFTSADLKEISAICRPRGIRTYLALNTVIFDEELAEMRELAEQALANGITAAIATDFAVLEFCCEIGLPIHISTQANITNAESVRFYARYADTLVLARELTLEQVADIADSILRQNICGPSGEPVKIEVFVHGALCMAVSGKCYLSLHENNSSANRGECFQTCRKGYIVTESESGYQLEIDNEYIMSPKDLCTIGFIDKIIESGAKILKIEGRGRSPEYVKTTTECYREAVDAYFAGDYTPERIAGWEKRLAKVFNRGFWDGYYLGAKLGQWSSRYGSSATKRKIYLGKATNYYRKLGVAAFWMQNSELSSGDTALVIGPTTGALEFPVGEIWIENEPVPAASRGSEISLQVPDVVRRNDKLYKLVDRNLR